MKQKFSRKWISSKQPRKQRKYRYNASMHIRHKLVSAHLDKALRQIYKRRAIGLRKGDEVVVMNGEHKGRYGKVSIISLKKLKIFVDGIKTKKASGQEVDMPLEPSNLKITKLYLEDKERRKIIARKVKI